MSIQRQRERDPKRLHGRVKWCTRSKQNMQIKQNIASKHSDQDPQANVANA